MERDGGQSGGGRRTKIVCTIGPACDSAEGLDRLVSAGMDVARLNASHSEREELERRLSAVRAAADRGGRHIAVILDLAGAKVRLGEVAGGTRLAVGESFILFTDGRAGDTTGVSVSHPGLPQDVSAGDVILIDDGRIELVVAETGADRIETRVTIGGPLGSRKGLNVPGVTLGADSLTARDLADAGWAADAGVDYVAQSFVRAPSDVLSLKEHLGEGGPPVIAKIETHEALDALEEIVEAGDAVMVARGDLGVETSSEDVPVLQRRITETCRRRGTPVIIATQMLESMVTESRPTRAEASDVANAIFDGVDAVMLSAETAIGAHADLSVATMARIALRAEGAAMQQGLPQWEPDPEPGDVTGAVSMAVCRLAGELELAAIVPATRSGATALAVAAHRPSTPIVAATHDPAVARRLSLVWGVTALVVAESGDLEHAFAEIAQALEAGGFAKSGERFAVTAGVTRGVSGATDLVKVHEVG